jgi:hypothetical protein
MVLGQQRRAKEALTSNDLDSGNAILLGLVGKHGAGDAIANGVDAGHAGTEVIVDLNATAGVELHANLLYVATTRVMAR